MTVTGRLAVLMAVADVLVGSAIIAVVRAPVPVLVAFGLIYLWTFFVLRHLASR
jgi:hypothetical protein